MAMQVGGGGGVKSDINVTPLVDVMLVLLIIMMIVAPMLQQGVSLTLPIAQHGVDKPETQEQTVVAVDPAGRFYVGAAEVSDDELGKRVLDVLASKNERIVLIKADRAVEYGRVMTAMDALTKAGIEEIALITGQPANRDGEGE